MTTMTVWKYILQPSITLSMPIGAQVLSVREQGRDICLWALVDVDASHEDRTFITHGTGQTIVEDRAKLRFLGTAFHGPLVFHVFESLT